MLDAIHRHFTFPPIGEDGCDFSSLARARGSIDVLGLAEQSKEVAGWILHPSRPLDRVAVYINGALLGIGPIAWRGDLEREFRSVPHSGWSGFHVRGTAADVPEDLTSVLVVGERAGQEPVCFRSVSLAQRAAPSAVPGDGLMRRVAGNNSAEAFAQVGLNAAVDLMDAVERHLGTGSARTVLDWGCGPGRVASFLAQLYPEIELTGGDIDPEAIAWCDRQIRPGAFHVVGPYPPLPFAEGSFDAVLACSVMTHLAWPEQRVWLTEIRRVVRPGGLFIASVHGTFAASFFPALTARLERQGIVDDIGDNSLDGIAPAGYYRAVFQTPSVTRDRWSRVFEWVEYIEAGLVGFQDLVVLRRPD
jgi:SAM-dependent methyltransferase